MDHLHPLLPPGAFVVGADGQPDATRNDGHTAAAARDHAAAASHPSAAAGLAPPSGDPLSPLTSVERVHGALLVPFVGAGEYGLELAEDLGPLAA